MSKLTIKAAIEVIPVSESTLRRDLASGKVSSEKDGQGRRRIDTAELIRVYGELKTADTPTPVSVNTPDTPKILALLEAQVDDLKAQLQTATTEKQQLLDLLAAEKAEKQALMPPPEEEPSGNSSNWLRRLIGFSQ